MDNWVGKIFWRRERLLTPVFWPGEFHGLYSPWSRKESDTTCDFHFNTQYNHSSTQILELVKNFLKKKQTNKQTKKNPKFSSHLQRLYVYYLSVIFLLIKNTKEEQKQIYDLCNAIGR